MEEFTVSTLLPGHVQKLTVFIADFESSYQTYLKTLFGLVMRSKYNSTDILKEADIIIADYDIESNKELIKLLKNKYIVLITDHPGPAMLIDNAIVLNKPMEVKGLKLALEQVDIKHHEAVLEYAEETQDLQSGSRPLSEPIVINPSDRVAVDFQNSDNTKNQVDKDHHERPEELEGVIQQVNTNRTEQMYDSQFVGSHADIKALMGDELTSVCFNAEKYFYSVLIDAYAESKQKSRIIFIETPFGDAYVDFSLKKLRHNFSHKRVIHTAMFYNLKIKAVSNSRAPDDGFEIVGFYDYTWELMLKSVRGRLPATADLDGNVYITRWPGLSRLIRFNHLLRIMAFWANKPTSLIQTATELKIPQRYVFTAYTALYSIGMAEILQPEKNAEILASPKKPKKQQGILKQLLTYIKREK